MYPLWLCMHISTQYQSFMILKSVPHKSLFFCDVIIAILKSVCMWAHLTPYSILLNHSVSSSCHLNLQDESGNTALHYAVTENHLDLIKMLLSKGASVVLKNGKNMTPLQCSLEMVSWPLYVSWTFSGILRPVQSDLCNHTHFTSETHVHVCGRFYVYVWDL